MSSNNQVKVETFVDDSGTSTGTHLLICEETKKCAIIDPVLVFEYRSGRTSAIGADKIIDFIESNNLQCEYILETHVHADHQTSAAYLKKALDNKPKIGIGANITVVQETFKQIFNLNDSDCSSTGKEFDVLFKEGDEFRVGNINVSIIETPGHTPACITYYIKNDCCFAGDTIFLPDQGTARCDFPKGSAEILWNSIQKILALPENVRIFVAHDYGGVEKKREKCFHTSVKDELEKSIHVKKGITKEQFIKKRTERDLTLQHPQLLLPSLQVNIRAGEFPKPESNGVSYLKIPLNSI